MISTNSWRDNLTAIVKIAIDGLFVRHPIDTAMGILFGILLHGLVIVFSPMVNVLNYLRAASLSALHYCALGVFVFNINNFRNRHKTHPEVNERFNFIQQQLDLGRITPYQARHLRLVLIQKVLENVQLDLDTQTKASAIDSVSDILQ